MISALRQDTPASERDALDLPALTRSLLEAALNAIMDEQPDIACENGTSSRNEYRRRGLATPPARLEPAQPGAPACSATPRCWFLLRFSGRILVSKDAHKTAVRPDLRIGTRPRFYLSLSSRATPMSDTAKSTSPCPSPSQRSACLVETIRVALIGENAHHSFADSEFDPFDSRSIAWLLTELSEFEEYIRA